MLRNSIRRHCRLQSRNLRVRSKHSLSAEQHVIQVPHSERPLVLSWGKLAKFADGSCTAALDDTAVLVVAVSDSKGLPESDAASASSFTPLTVNFRLKSAASSVIPSTLSQRDLTPTDSEILTGRAIDRSVRPLFAPGFDCNTQLTCNVLANKRSSDVVVASINAASMALASAPHIRWNGPVGACRVSYTPKSGFEVNPRRPVYVGNDDDVLDLVIAGTSDCKALMIESQSNEMDYTAFSEAVECGLESCASISKEMAKLWPNLQRGDQSSNITSEATDSSYLSLTTLIASLASDQLRSIFGDAKHDKISRDLAVNDVKAKMVADQAEMGEQHSAETISHAFSTVVKAVITDMILTEGRRVDGRTLDEVRPISCETNLYGPLHGSALFQRGQTQVLASVALDSQHSRNVHHLAELLIRNNFKLHYEFPAYATNEISSTNHHAAGRREIGHGALADRALAPLIPVDDDDMPFKIRVLCQVLESNGSSSMASVCAGSLALMDAGIKLANPAAGVAMGLVTSDMARPVNGDANIRPHAVLTDILGMEDYFGLMDFKIAGTGRGITAAQCDVKSASGISIEVIREALEAGKKGIDHILTIMSDQCLSQARTDRKASWPAAKSLIITDGKRSRFLGEGNRNLRYLWSEFGIKYVQDDENPTKWTLFAGSQRQLDEASVFIESMMTDQPWALDQLKFGEIIDVNVIEVLANGIFVQVHPTLARTFIRKSQVDPRHVALNLKGESGIGIEPGEVIKVKYFGVDPSSGEIRLSRTALLVAQSQASRRMSGAR